MNKYSNLTTEEFWDTCVKATQSFHKNEEIENLGTTIMPIGSVFHFADLYGEFYRNSANVGTLEQAETGLRFKIHFGDVEIADHFQEILDHVGDVTVRDLREPFDDEDVAGCPNCGHKARFVSGANYLERLEQYYCEYCNEAHVRNAYGKFIRMGVLSEPPMGDFP